MIMKVSDLFDIKYGINLELNALKQADGKNTVNFVSRTADNNGVVARVNLIPGKKPHPAGVITCAGGGSVLSAFVQIEPFYSGRDLYILIPKENMSLEKKLFYCHAIKMNAYRYSYGRQANKTLKEINLPDIPDWLRNFQIDYSKIITKNEKKNLSINTNNWQKFTIHDLFICEKGKDIIGENGCGNIPLVSATERDNGILNYTKAGNKLFNGNCLTVATNGSIGFSFYQKEEFFATGDICVLKPRYIFNTYIGLFISSLLMQEKIKYSYGRKFNLQRIQNTEIKLPVNSKNEPDWQYMENYIKSLPYADLI